MTVVKDIFVQIRSINGKTYAVKHNEVFLLDGVGLEIWQLLDGQNTVMQISEKIAEKYNKSVNDITEDVIEFINELLEDKLIEIE
ncbi:PqqD family protein [Fictibacillus nanhaiensis]|uniref:PqqD family protein n=1 Tax=Fictibacillus nanhaiensis TaxID=742169 RepID=A0ABS2ZRX2_9BACL|nr:PqqD family protein [Fictibacillus nanhaiensis]